MVDLHARLRLDLGHVEAFLGRKTEFRTFWASNLSEAVG
jgi:hypothetical protein